jgi:DNA (cytosine-5)-methyltransferase 1
MWNAVDDWVIKSSNFHSLFELYGHFTEPHPIFSIIEFQKYSDHPIVEFAKHVADFDNCSRYFPREHLTSLFGVKFGVNNFVELVKTLRRYRFDIRCYEINIAIPKDVYMVSYPFTLPFGKQMNFSVKSAKLKEDNIKAVSI